MPDSPFVFAGAQVSPTAAASLHTNEFFSGLWTQGNPLGPGAVPYLYRNYAARYDRLVGGVNVEVSTRLTPVRRPGSSVYNPGPFPPVNRFYEFRGFSSQGERIRIMASCDPATGATQGTVRDVTAPTTNLIVWTKDKNAGRTSFISVGNILYMGDGIDSKMLIQSKRSWGVSITGIPANIGTINAVQLYRVRLGPPPSLIQTIAVFTLTAPPAITLVNGQVINLAGLTTLSSLNGQSFIWSAGLSSFVTVAANQVALNISSFYTHPLSNTVETGTMSTLGAQFNSGEFIIDPNGNIQEATGAQLANISNIQVDNYTVGGSAGRLVTLFFSPTTPMTISPGVHLSLAGLSTVAGLNGSFYPVNAIKNSNQVQMQIAGTSIPVTPYSNETGTAQTGSGNSASVAPSWGTNPGDVTIDGGQQWVCKGPAIEDWGFSGPTVAPSVTQVAAPSIYGGWVADTFFAPLFVIQDSNGNLEQLTTGGTTGSAAPAWSTTVGGTTNDGTAIWTNLGPSAWQANHAYALNALILATYTYYVTGVTISNTWNGYTYVPTPTPTQVPITVTSLFKCIQAGTSGANQPSFINGLNASTQDNTVGWQNLGNAKQWSDIGATQKVSTGTTIVDSNGYIERIQGFGKTGSTAPTWQGQGKQTVETLASYPPPPATWLNAGPYTAGTTGAWTWAYSGKSSITGHVSTASPVSLPVTVTQGNFPVIQGLGVPNPPEDRIVLWRTMQGGNQLFELDEIPNPGAGQPWVYTDTTPDLPAGGSLGLNQLVLAPIADDNNPPPKGFIPQAYYLGRIWGYVGNILRYSAGPDTLAGSGDQSFPSANQFTFPSLGVKCWATSIGLICYTESDVWIVLGQGTASSPFYVVNFQEGVGLANQDAFAVNGSTAYGMLTSGQVVSMDPGAGEVEVGFPIGDLFNLNFSPSQTYCAWHQASSSDMALYVADGSTGWHRMAAIAAPEEGNVWSPKANIQGGVKAVASLEIVPGLKVLLMGPAQDGQPILMRDSSTHADNAVAYQAYFDIGSLILAEPGATVGMQYIVTEEAMIAGATPLSVGVIFDEISGTYLTLRNRSPDPPNLPRSKTVMVQRSWVGQDANTIQRCRHMQQRVTWPAENFPNELFTNTLYGRVAEKARK